MALTLEEVVPWGRSLDEYRRMFAFNEADMGRRILGCADGPSSFNAELAVSGRLVISCDPIYRFSTDEIRQRINAASPQIIQYARENAEEFVWSDEIPDADALARQRTQAMERFLADFEAGRQADRYVAAGVPALPFSDGSFDVAVCSHFLFLYSEQLSAHFHVASIRELMRVASELRIFPLTEHGAKRSRHVDSVTMALGADGYRVVTETVNYEFQRGGNQMMRITR